MIFKLLTALASASLAFAATPAGFQPATNTELIVSYNGQPQQNGIVAIKECEF